MTFNDPKAAESSQRSETGSPRPGEPVFLTVGQLRRTHGIGGEMLMSVLTDFPERLRPRRKVFIGRDHTPVRLRSVRWADQSLLVAFEGYDTPEQASRFRSQYVMIQIEDLPDLPEGEYYYHQLIGLEVQDVNGQVLGKLVEIIETGANDVYVVRPLTGSDILLPAIEPVILDINLEKGVMRVKPPEWL